MSTTAAAYHRPIIDPDPRWGHGNPWWNQTPSAPYIPPRFQPELPTCHKCGGDIDPCLPKPLDWVRSTLDYKGRHRS